VENAALVWWFLRDRRLDVAEATKKLVKCLRWRQKFRAQLQSGQDVVVLSTT
jgi:hypothetical protein